ncbi:MAG: rhodanese-like domain-containing protein [Thiotrichales bacterium]
MKKRTTLIIMIILSVSMLMSSALGNSAFNAHSAEDREIWTRNISTQELATLLKQNIPLIDIRRPEEWKQTGIIKGSHLVTMFNQQGRFNRDFPQKLSQLIAPDQPFILICRTGNRTAIGARILQEYFGFTRIYNATHGITHWIAEDRAVEHPPIALQAEDIPRSN